MRELKKYPATTDIEPRHERTSGLLGAGGLDKLKNTTVFVIGLGGVGSWAAEVLARSGVGKIHLMDMDVVELTNVNRQLQAFPDVVGQSKSEILAQRLRMFGTEVIAITNFIDDIFLEKYPVKPQYIVEAIDHIEAKCSILNWAVSNKIPIATSMGAANRIHPEYIKVCDLSQVTVCPMAKDVRKILRRKYGFSMDAVFGIPAVSSIEVPWRSEKEGIKGSLLQVTMAFGAALASIAINEISLPGAGVQVDSE